MDLDSYLEAVGRFADQLDHHDVHLEVEFSQLLDTEPLAAACVDFRSQSMTPAEATGAAKFRELGLYRRSKPNQQDASWLFYEDILHARLRRSLARCCEPYSRAQSLFEGAPQLFDAVRRKSNGVQDLELIDDRAVRIERGVLYHAGPGYAHLVEVLPPEIPEWARAAFPNAPRYLRLDPHRFFPTEPAIMLRKATTVPANPKWVHHVGLFPNQADYAQYDHLEYDADDRGPAWRDFALTGVQRLEVSVQRPKPDYLRMMMEELPVPTDRSGVMVGRCIHLDTAAPAGTPMNQVSLKHLDLAINVYLDERRAARMRENLQSKMRVKASFRTHLYRIEGIPFPAAFSFAEQFFRSQHLLSEWLTDLGVAVPA